MSKKKPTRKAVGNRSTQVLFRIKPADKKTIKKAAANAGETMGSWCIRTLLEAAEKQSRGE